MTTPPLVSVFLPRHVHGSLGQFPHVLIQPKIEYNGFCNKSLVSQDKMQFPSN